MLRQIWWQPFYSPAQSSVVTITTTESWSFPITVVPARSSNTLVEDPIDMVEMGHKEVA